MKQKFVLFVEWLWILVLLMFSAQFSAKLFLLNRSRVLICLRHRRFIRRLRPASRGAALRWPPPSRGVHEPRGYCDVVPALTRCDPLQRPRLASVRKGPMDAQLCDGKLSTDAITLLQKRERRWNCTGRNWRAPERDGSLIEFRT